MTKLVININLYSLITRTIGCLFIYIPLTVALFFIFTEINIKSLKIHLKE